MTKEAKMQYLAALHTDAGTRKKKNQDSMVIMEARTEAGRVLFACVCDGMGGLSRGEAASAAAVQAFADWFETELPGLAGRMRRGSFREEELRNQWSAVIDRANSSILDYGRERGICLGTTAVGVLFLGGRYFTVNVGDSRVYLLTDKIRQLTRDQSFVQQEVDAGRMTYEESMTDPRRNVLMQCIGADVSVCPEFGSGSLTGGQVFLVCSDGFRHVVSKEEIYRAFSPPEMTEEEIMKKHLQEMTQLIMDRRETDNISAILVRVV